MKRITIKTLRALCDIIARETNAPNGPLWRQEDGRNIANVGALFIEPGSAMYGTAWKLVRMHNEDGGECVILSASTARGLCNQMHAYKQGIDAR